MRRFTLLLSLLCTGISTSAQVAKRDGGVLPMDPECPCGPATQFLNYATREQAARAAGLYVAQAQAVGKTVEARKELEYKVMDWSLMPAQMGFGVVPVLGDVVNEAVTRAKDAFKADAKAMAVQVIRAHLSLRPEIKDLSQIEKRTIIADALAAASADPSFNTADAFQNEAIELLSESIAELSSREDFFSNQLQQSTADQLKMHVALRAKLDALLEGKTPLPTAPLSRPPEEALREQLKRAADISDVASGQLSAASGIAEKLGNRKLAGTLQKGSEIAAVGAACFHAFASNPLAYLPAINGAMGLFKGGSGNDMAWFSQALANLSKQIADLATQVQKNHEDTMRRLDYIEFVGGVNNAGIKELLAKDIGNCEYMTPHGEDWRNKQDKRFFDYGRPLVFASWEDMVQMPYDRWSRCKNGLQDVFQRGQVSMRLRLELAPIGPDLESTEQAELRYAAAKRIYPSAGNVNYLYAAPRWVEDYDQPTFAMYTSEAISLAGINNHDPRTAKWLLDPASVDLLGGYALALHSLMQFPGGDRWPSNSPPAPVAGEHNSALDLLQVALGHVNLAIAQQQMLSGVVREVKPTVTSEELTAYFSEVPYAATQLGTLTVGGLLHDRGSRDSYRIFVSKGNLKWTRPLMDAYRPLGSTDVSLRFEQDSAGQVLVADVKWAAAGTHTLVLPKPDAMADRIVVPQTDALHRLVQLQARLMMAIKAYTQQPTKSFDVATYDRALLLASVTE